MDGSLGLQVQCHRPGAGYCSQAGLGWVPERNLCGFTALGINVSIQIQALLWHGRGVAGVSTGPQLRLPILLINPKGVRTEV